MMGATNFTFYNKRKLKGSKKKKKFVVAGSFSCLGADLGFGGIDSIVSWRAYSRLLYALFKMRKDEEG